jgi:hypothetical protein
MFRSSGLRWPGLYVRPKRHSALPAVHGRHLGRRRSAIGHRAPQAAQELLQPEGTHAAPVDASAVRNCLMSRQRGHPISRQDLQGRAVTDARPEEVVLEDGRRDVHRSHKRNHSALPEPGGEQKETARRLRFISPPCPAELSRPSESPGRLSNFRDLGVPGLPRTDCWAALQVSGAPNLPDAPIQG